ncbi:uncharacterized protein LOC101861287 [Aplysia californica]|uniref:Uncharacterized protein LOC101861287 n=1 Tax=Aplysia californica TaxID=6500 RepID=A0ABM0JRW4_APLCA|nr:uncharacterized protein LOC101861287 [Aplysia californica]
MTSEVVIRPARMSDYSAVVDGIGDVYWGRDHLPAKYSEFVQDPDFLSFVAEADGEVIGFYVGELVDNKQTLHKRAGRIKDEYKGQGIFTKLSDAIDTEAAKLSTAKREVMACSKQTAERISKGYAQKKGLEQIVHMKLYYTILVKSDVPKADPSTFQNVHELTLKDMEELFDDEVAWNRLIRQGRLCVHYVPLRRVKENIRHVINHRTKTFMSFGSSGVKDAGVPAESHVQNASLLSTIHYFPVSLGLAFYSDFYGSDFTDLESHLQMHIHHLNEAKKTRIGWVINVPFDLDSDVRERLKDVLSAYGIPLTQDPNVTDVLMFEATSQTFK